MIPKILAMLSTTYPTFLDHPVIVTYFFRGPLISLDMNKLPGVKESTILSVPRLNPSLRELELTRFGKISDERFASIFSKLTQLRVLVLRCRDCLKVGLKTVVAIAKSCPRLQVANLSYTSTPPIAIGDLLLSCPQLEVLKLAGISNWTDATFSKLAKTLDEKTRFVCLRTSLNFMISLFPNLRRLDLSFTPAKHPPILSSPGSPDLEKLSLTSTLITSSDLLAIIVRLPHLKTLSLGALGVGESSKITVGNSSAMTMNDVTLRDLTAILANFRELESMSLVANTKLCMTSRTNSAVQEFVQLVGRRCKYLNLSGIPSIRSNDLVGLVAEGQDDTPSMIERLLLNHTGVDDAASASISCCHNLITLELSGTKFTNDGLFPILDACSRLEHLDLTSCRGVPVWDRRQFFQVWERERNS
ncbi:RNI-like protein [Marasmius fiardii PR-910]|nr:RNI-like protein [Marasmius fiardii PR-910]